MALQRRSTRHNDTSHPSGRLQSQGIQVDDELSVRAYLREHPDVEPILDATINQLRARYAPGDRLTLDVTQYDDGDEMLGLTVYSALSEDEAERRLRQFDNDWWLNQESAAFANIVVLVTGQ